MHIFKKKENRIIAKFVTLGVKVLVSFFVSTLIAWPFQIHVLASMKDNNSRKKLKAADDCFNYKEILDPHAVKEIEEAIGKKPLNVSERFDILKHWTSEKIREQGGLDAFYGNFVESKNRYDDVFSPSKTRVILKDNGYIHANYMGPKNEFIGTQAPLNSTTDDFWQMVFEQNSPLIVNLTTQNDITSRKLNPYWMWPKDGAPDSRYSVNIDSVEATLDAHKNPLLVTRKLTVKENSTGKTRSVTQVHFLGWPNEKAPTSKDLTTFLHKMHENHAGEDPKRPTIVHCSAGVGRTGTAIGALLLGREKENKAPISEDSIEKMVLELRIQRGEKTIQTPAQLETLYNLLKSSSETKDDAKSKRID